MIGGVQIRECFSCLNLLLILVTSAPNPPILPLPLLSLLLSPRFQVNLSTFPLFSELYSGVLPESFPRLELRSPSARQNQEGSLPWQMGRTMPGKGMLAGLPHSLTLANGG